MEKSNQEFLAKLETLIDKHAKALDREDQIIWNRYARKHPEAQMILAE